ncbi:MAG: S49 family peptidase, partial [Bacteroidales bacterium]
MKSFFKILLATILALVIVSAFGTIFLISALGGMFASEQVVETKDSSILEIKLEEPIYDRASTNPVDNVDWQSFKVKKALGLNTLLEAIHRAKNDEKIKGIYLNTGSNNTMGFATAQELRHALSKFKASGKFIYAYSNFYTQNAYYLASVADSVFLQPEGAVDFKGLNIKMMFYKNLLSKLGVEMQVIRHGRFKSAVEPFIRTDMSSENKEQYRVLVSSMWGSIIEEIAQSRKVSVAQLNLSADSLAGMLAQDALSHQLVDVVAPYKVFQTSLMKRMKVKEEDKLNLISIQKYMQTEKEIKKTNNKIAVIYAQGEIGMDKGSSYS